MHLVLSRSGTVLAVDGGAPASWVGARLDARDDVPGDLRAAGQAVLRSAAHSVCPVAMSFVLQSTQQPAHLTVVDALPLRRAPTDLPALVRSILHVMEPQMKAHDVTLTVEIGDDVPSAMLIDGAKIAWALTALVGNALRYVRHGSPRMPGGSITVRATRDPATRDVTLEVQDDGPGIPAETVRVLSGTEADYSRLGLGLAMIRDVVAAHGGTLEIRSDVDAFGHGTTIRLTLPVA